MTEISSKGFFLKTHYSVCSYLVCTLKNINWKRSSSSFNDFACFSVEKLKNLLIKFSWIKKSKWPYFISVFLIDYWSESVQIVIILWTVRWTCFWVAVLWATFYWRRCRKYNSKCSKMLKNSKDILFFEFGFLNDFRLDCVLRSIHFETC